jgi:UDP-N-acetylglucosamine pyrophosphorylase
MRPTAAKLAVIDGSVSKDLWADLGRARSHDRQPAFTPVVVAPDAPHPAPATCRCAVNEIALEDEVIRVASQDRFLVEILIPHPSRKSGM